MGVFRWFVIFLSTSTIELINFLTRAAVVYTIILSYVCVRFLTFVFFQYISFVMFYNLLVLKCTFFHSNTIVIGVFFFFLGGGHLYTLRAYRLMRKAGVKR